jgi:hypothetical protein
MSRFSMALVAAAASALVATAMVALPAFGGDSGSPTSPTKPAPDFSAFVACLNAHGLTGAPATPEQFKPWLGAKEASDPQATKAAEKACGDQAPKRVVGNGPDSGPDMQELGACLRSHGLDAPTAPDALKRWLADQSGGPAFVACKMQLDPGKPGAGDKKLPDCGTPAQPPADKAPADQAPADQAARSST